jgi:hypothetical protein
VESTLQKQRTTTGSRVRDDVWNDRGCAAVLVIVKGAAHSQLPSNGDDLHTVPSLKECQHRHRDAQRDSHCGPGE